MDISCCCLHCLLSSLFVVYSLCTMHAAPCSNFLLKCEVFHLGRQDHNAVITLILLNKWFNFRFIINLLVVNILSSCMYLPLVMLDLLVSPSPSSPEEDSVSVMAQCVLSVTVSHWIASLSMLSTLAIAVDQYLAILHALRYHHHMTRLRSSLSLCSVWVINCVNALTSTGLLTALAREPTILWRCCADRSHLPGDKHGYHHCHCGHHLLHPLPAADRDIFKDIHGSS